MCTLPFFTEIELAMVPTGKYFLFKNLIGFNQSGTFVEILSSSQIQFKKRCCTLHWNFRFIVFWVEVVHWSILLVSLVPVSMWTYMFLLESLLLVLSEFVCADSLLIGYAVGSRWPLWVQVISSHSLPSLQCMQRAKTNAAAFSSFSVYLNVSLLFSLHLYCLVTLFGSWQIAKAMHYHLVVHLVSRSYQLLHCEWRHKSWKSWTGAVVLPWSPTLVVGVSLATFWLEGNQLYPRPPWD